MRKQFFNPARITPVSEWERLPVHAESDSLTCSNFRLTILSTSVHCLYVRFQTWTRIENEQTDKEVISESCISFCCILKNSLVFFKSYPLLLTIFRALPLHSFSSFDLDWESIMFLRENSAHGMSVRCIWKMYVDWQLDCHYFVIFFSSSWSKQDTYKSASPFNFSLFSL